MFTGAGTSARLALAPSRTGARGAPLGHNAKTNSVLRHLVPRSVVERPSAFLLVHTTPLFEEEGHAGAGALITDVDDPLGFHGPRAWAGLAPNDHPVDTIQV